MRRALLLVGLLCGCIPSVGTAPPPRDMLAQGSTADVIRESARALALAEFEIVHSDAASGTLQARRVRGPHGNDQYINCAHDRASIAATNLRSTVAITVSATPRGDSAAVRIATVVTASYPSLSGVMAKADNEKDCVSNGSAETALAQSLTATRR